MADSAEKKAKLKQLHRTLSRDFVRFLDEKTPGPDPCPVCKTDDWSVVCPQDGDDMYRLGLVIRNADKPFYLSTFAYYCDNCGYVRQHISKIVHDWAKKNPDEDEADPAEQAELDEQEITPDE